jgi:fructokinase
MQNNFNIIIGLGEILWDLLPQGKQLGGAPANFAYHAQALGAKSYVISAVGNDSLGNEIITHLDDVDINQDFIEILNEYPTGTVDVHLDSEGKPDFIIHKEVAWDYIPFSERLKQLAGSASAVCYGTLAQRSAVSRKSIRDFLDHTPNNCLRVLDINLRQNYYSADLIQESLELANCLKLNEDELPIVAKLCSFQGDDEKILASIYQKYDLKIIALTKGKDGSQLFRAGESTVLGTPEVKIVDTVGAGDAFTAALVMGMLKEYPLKRIHNNATKLAAFVCSQKGATPKLSEELRLSLL